jgi:hypothetical protein
VRSSEPPAFAAPADLQADSDDGDVDPASHHRGGAVFRHRPFAWWLIAAAAFGPDISTSSRHLIGSWFGRLVLFGFTWALVHHMLGGLRHFIWDTGRGFDLKLIEWMAKGDADRIGGPDAADLDRRLRGSLRRADMT